MQTSPSRALRKKRIATPGRAPLVIVIVTLLVSAVVPPVLAVGGAFTDDDGSTHEANIELVAEAGITLGCGEGLFCPDDPVTRAQMASFVVRALGYVDDGGGDLFTDDDGTTHEANIDLLAAAGVTLGCGVGVFCPDDAVTRGQMASFIARAFHYDVAAAGSGHFGDDDGTTHEANINLLFEAGVTQGCSADGLSFCPGDVVTRGQMASFLARALKLPWPVDQSDHPDIAAENADRLGAAVAMGDFNADGWDDIAVGIPGENAFEGAVRVIYGTAGGPTGPTQFFTDVDFAVTPLVGAVLGTSLAVGDFDDDGYDDLAIGANDPAASDRARVMLTRGGPSGLAAEHEIYRGTAGSGVVRTMVAGHFGNVDGEGIAIGFGAQTVNGEVNAGAVYVIHLLPGTYIVTSVHEYHQDTDGVGGVVEASDNFGGRLAAGDLTGDGYDELVIGVTGEDLNIVNDELNVGVVHVFYGSPDGLRVDYGTSPEIIHQAHIGAENENGDGFGSSIAIGDFTGDGIGDLVVGASGEDLETPSVVEDRGNVYIIPGSVGGPVGTDAFDLDELAGSDQPLEADRRFGAFVVVVSAESPMIVVPSGNDVDAEVLVIGQNGLEYLDTSLFNVGFYSFTDLGAGDINGDQAEDLVIGSAWLPVPDGSEFSYAGGIAVWLGQPDGSLEPWAGGLIQ